MTQLFHDARLKIERAKKHIRDLNAILVRINTNSHAVLVETNPDTGYDSLKFEFGEAVPEQFMCIAGDALHNLHTALDFVANDIEFSTTGKRSRRTKFPVYNTRDELVAAVNGGFKHKAPQRIIDFIVDVVQPYESGDGKAIWAMHALDIEDKHRLLVPHVELQWLRLIRYKDESGEEFELPEWATTKRPSKFPTGKRNVEVTDKGKASVSVVFAHGLPLGGKHIFPTLNNLAVFIDRTIFGIERTFLGT
jgi:hypothetical protein